MSVYNQLLIVSLSSFPIFTSLAKATLSAHVEQLRLNTSMSVPTDVTELPHYTSLLVDSACRTAPSGRCVYVRILITICDCLSVGYLSLIWCMM